jgi:curved DNA-binding protein CbpA
MTYIDTQNHYKVLGVTPWASDRQIRQAYRDLSKLFHPDTTELVADEAIAKFRMLNDAYAVLSNPERRADYDHQIQFSRFTVPGANLHLSLPDKTNWRYDDGLPSERPLSGGELFSLLVMLLTLILCSALAIAVALLRGDPLFPQA